MSVDECMRTKGFGASGTFAKEREGCELIADLAAMGFRLYLSGVAGKKITVWQRVKGERIDTVTVENGERLLSIAVEFDGPTIQDVWNICK